MVRETARRSAPNGREIVEERDAGEEKRDEKQRSPRGSPKYAAGFGYRGASGRLTTQVLVAAKRPRIDLERAPHEVCRGAEQKDDGERERKEEAVDELVNRHRYCS